MEGSSANSPYKPRHFVKPIIPGFLNEFLIPTEFFIQNMRGGQGNREEQCESGILRSNSMKNFPVIIKGRRLEAGWTEFAREHDLKIGDFLLFHHEGGLIFSVRVYGPSACEILYSSEDVAHQAHPVPFEGEATDVNSINVDDFVVLEKSHATNQRLIPITGHPPAIQDHKLTCVLKRSWASRMYISSRFAKRNGLSKRSCEMTLRDPNGKSWTVELLYTYGSSYIGNGWLNFRKAMGLRFGSSFTLEIIDNGEKPLISFWVKKQKKSNIHPKTATKVFRPPPSHLKHPSFEGNFNACSITSSRFFFPVKFARANGLCRKGLYEMVLNNQKGRSWNVGLTRRLHQLNGKTKDICIQSGWRDFQVANGLKLGDFFRFELVRIEPIPSANIYVIPPSTRQLKSVAKSKSLSNKALPNPMKLEARENITEANRDISLAGRLCFQGVIRNDYVTRRVRIPSHFARSIIGLITTYHEILLEDDKKRIWPVRLLCPPLKLRFRHSAYLGKGICHLLAANNFKNGDRFTFELINESPKLVAKFYRCEKAHESL